MTAREFTRSLEADFAAVESGRMADVSVAARWHEDMGRCVTIPLGRKYRAGGRQYKGGGR